MPKQSKQSNQSLQTGGTYKPAEYHGGDSGRYTATPAGLATGAYGEQAAVSQGVIRGDVAGPNLSWSGGNMLTGGGGVNNARNHQAGGGGVNNARNHQAGGGTYKPAEYYGGDSGRYTATPAGLATGAYGEQAAVSQGVIRGDVAGPNFSWSGGSMMTGGGARNYQAGGARRSRSTKRKSCKKTGKKTGKKYRSHSITSPPSL